MNEIATRLLFSLIRHDVCGEPLSDDTRRELTADILPTLYRLSKDHDMAHIVGHVLDKEGLLGTDEISKKIRKQYLLAIYRHQQLQYTLEQTEHALDRAGIDFLPLKGSVLRAYYPEGWMRTSCDVDVLVHPEDLERARDVLIEDCGFKKGSITPHDITLVTAGGMHLELHHTLIEDNRVARIDELLLDVWNYTTPTPDCPHRMILADEMFYFYHVAHAAKHFINGGCGIRPFLDDWILQHRVPHDDAKRQALIDLGGLSAFDDAKKRLRDVWFANAEHTALSSRLQEFILSGGTYGDDKTRIIVQQKKRGGAVRYLFSRIFPPYNFLKHHYPILKKHRWLMPVMQVRRWFTLLLKGKSRKLLREISVVSTASDEQINDAADLMSTLGL